MAKCFHSLWLDLLVLFLLLPCNSTVSASVSLGSYRDSVGQLRLFGTSFGLLGSNATFDYVVSLRYTLRSPCGNSFGHLTGRTVDCRWRYGRVDAWI